MKIYFHKKCGVFVACKKVTDFFETLKKSRPKDGIFAVCRKTYAVEIILPRSRGARGGKGPARNQIIAIKNVRYGLFDERSEIFRKNLFLQKCGVLWRFIELKKS